MTTTKMPSETPVLPAQTEKPQHYTYLKEFRTQQCSLFLQHKCTQHRPFTCFHWHFMNQRRRRPVRKRDGTFNYSPDFYCTKFDETTGLCPDGDECPFLHRTAGDTERRYHLRYYKTGTCVYETDTKGHCVKNGPHCAFAHGALDLRPPVYDIRELQAVETSDKSSSSPGTPNGSSIERERMLTEDPRWNDTNYVLANYKTEQCKRPPRLCRQGYACPQFHNSRDRRRSPKLNKYRSTPCPNVKHGDDWGDPTQCENGDNCTYCHTRTEQQFHPEIYKSTKCNDMVQTNYCPRGAFCAFAHVEQEMCTQRELMTTASDNSLAAILSTVLPASSPVVSTSEPQAAESHEMKNGTSALLKLPNPIGNERSCNVNISAFNPNIPPPVIVSNNSSSINHTNQSSNTLPDPIGKGRSNSIASTSNSDIGNSVSYPRAPGSEREDVQIKLRQQFAAIENDQTLDSVEKNKRKQNLIMLHNLSAGGSSSISTTVAAPQPMPSVTLPSSSMSPFAPAFYPPGDTVGSVVGHALDDLTLDDIDISSLDKELDRDNDTNSLSSSLSAGLSSTGFGASSLPIGIPLNGMPRGSIGSLSQSPPSPFGSLSHSIFLSQKELQLDQPPVSYLCHHNHHKFAGSPFGETNSNSPRSNTGGQHSPLSLQHSNSSSEVQRLREEMMTTKAKLEHWEQAYSQAKCACEAWKKEAEESVRKAKFAEEERNQSALSHLKKMKLEMQSKESPYIRSLQRSADLENISIPQLRQLQQQLRSDLEKIEQVLYKQQSVKCIKCVDKKRNISTGPCNHSVMCAECAGKVSECPLCGIKISQRNIVTVSNYQL
ncbi:hypothetical protein ACJMK2_034733 [Sinanodonta woodiana]|uniref:Unkempt protein n=1 Tax=Sinanodonta woodiana TaxID=1069815 RepID=A0ABD3WT32_SINWO